MAEQKDLDSTYISKRKKHGLSDHPLYQIWNKMVRRCNLSSDSGYKNYGAKGITVCEEWLEIENFIRDMFSTYSDGMTLERIDVTKGYYKDNCTWLSLEQQQRNKSCYENNVLGIAGVSLKTDSRGQRFIQARFQYDKKRYKKMWSLGKYQLEQAKTLAQEWLKVKRKQFGFGETHGIKTGA